MTEPGTVWTRATARVNCTEEAQSAAAPTPTEPSRGARNADKSGDAAEQARDAAATAARGTRPTATEADSVQNTLSVKRMPGGTVDRALRGVALELEEDDKLVVMSRLPDVLRERRNYTFETMRATRDWGSTLDAQVVQESIRTHERMSAKERVDKHSEFAKSGRRILFCTPPLLREANDIVKAAGGRVRVVVATSEWPENDPHWIETVKSAGVSGTLVTLAEGPKPRSTTVVKIGCCTTCMGKDFYDVPSDTTLKEIWHFIEKAYGEFGHLGACGQRGRGSRHRFNIKSDIFHGTVAPGSVESEFSLEALGSTEVRGETTFGVERRDEGCRGSSRPIDISYH